MKLHKLRFIELICNIHKIFNHQSYLFSKYFREELNSRGAVATNTWTITSAANGGRPTVAQKSSLEMKLHKLRFIELIRNGQNKMDAVQYARTHFPQFVQAHEREIQALMGALMFSGSR